MTQQRKEDVGAIRKKKEVLFMGKSNSGKSSLVNRVLGTEAARVSRRPVGITRVRRRPSTSSS